MRYILLIFLLTIGCTHIIKYDGDERPVQDCLKLSYNFIVLKKLDNNHFEGIGENEDQAILITHKLKIKHLGEIKDPLKIRIIAKKITDFSDKKIWIYEECKEDYL